MHEEVAGGGAAVNAEGGDLAAGVLFHGGEEVGDLVGNAFQSGAGDMGGGGGAGEAEERAAGGGVPIGRAEAGEGGDEEDAAAVGDLGGEVIHLGGGFYYL